jgi:AraC family transcriptional regulator, transcriptional activator of pobA
MKNKAPVHLRTIHEFHAYRGLPAPEHPLISVVNYADIQHNAERDPDGFILDFYSVSLKRTTNAKMKYGQQEYDFDAGVLFFIAPQQVFSVTPAEGAAATHTGWILLIHPDFLWNTPLAAAINKYDFFDYAVNEALFLSEKEETIIHGIIDNIRQEYHSSIDTFSQRIIISQLETLLNYSERFYQRQFITRKISNHRVLDQLEAFLNDYINQHGLPGVQLVADALHISPSYLSGLLKTLTGASTQEHIHRKLIAKAKEKLSTTQLSVSEIAYELGFEHPQSFSKLFKAKTAMTPAEFRSGFQ